MRFVINLLLFAVCALCGAIVPNNLAAQMIQQQVPFSGVNSSFFESNGATFSLSGPNFAANFGGAAPPPFGGFDPNSGLRTGFGFQRGGVSGSLGFNFSQGSSRSNVATTPSLTTMDGVPGAISSGVQRPFVTGIVPVVGSQSFAPVVPNHVGAFSSVQQTQMEHIQERQSVQQHARQERAQASYDRGMKAEKEGNLRMARANYRNALGGATGELRRQIKIRMQSRGW